MNISYNHNQAYICSNITSAIVLKENQIQKHLGLHYGRTILHIVMDIVVVFHEVFFHPSVPSSIHGWHHTGKKTLAEINNPSPSAHVSLSKKGMPGPMVLIVKRLGQCVIEAEIIIGNNVSKCVFIFLFEWHLHWTTLGYICHLRSFPMVNYMLLSHESQALQTSRFSTAKVLMDTCRMWYK